MRVKLPILMLLLVLVLCSQVFGEKLVGEGYEISTDRINEVLKIDAFTERWITFDNLLTSSRRITITLSGNVSDIVRLDKDFMTISPSSSETLKLTLFGMSAGNYNGSLKISEVDQKIQINIKVYDPDLVPVSALYIEVEPTQDKVLLGEVFKFRVNIYNLLVERNYNATLEYAVWQIGNLTENITVYEESEEVEVRTSDSLLREFEIQKNLAVGAYTLRVDAQYLNLTSSASTVFFITKPFYNLTIFGIELWKYFLALVLLSLLIFGIRYYKKKQEAKKRYHTKFDLRLLPKPGLRSIFLGKIAESEHKAYFELDNLTTHTIVAGSTGGGKTVAAQDIVEEALEKNIAVVVFDPTAQWSGMLRKCQNKRMLDLYPKFGMKPSDAKAFNGNVRAITDAREVIDLKKYLKPGEIQIFTINKLDPEDIDTFVANTVREVFHANFPEEQELKYLIVYDEVHRLLSKFGGSGEGFIQIERACREFRKWGIGVLLISQVLADFVGQIKANINTEIQLRTRDEGDLKRIATKYGKDLLRSLVKASVGTGMLQNSAYNRGLPYFVSFRPMMHSIKRLSDNELEGYNQYNSIIDDYEYQLIQLDDEGVDTFDMKLELKLALDKVKSGSFNMVEIYLDGLTSRLNGEWSKLRKTPKKKQISFVKETALKEELQKAKLEREEYLKKESEKEKKVEKKEGVLLFKNIYGPITFDNGAIVSTLQDLLDALLSMDDEIFSSHVNEQKNDIYNWIKNVVDDESLTKKLESVTKKSDILETLAKEKKLKRKVEEAPAKEEVSIVQKSEPKGLINAHKIIGELNIALDSQDIANAKEVYKSLLVLYKGLSKEEKAKIHKQSVELHKKLVALDLFVSR